MRKLTRIVSAVLAAVTAAVLCVSAYAEEFVYNFDDSTLEDGIEADTYDINGTEITLEKSLGAGETDPGMSVRCVLFNEYIDPEFWNDPEVTVSIDVRLDTEGVNVIGYIIGFDSKWTWINPSDFTVLKYNEWITITETGAHFYEYFKSDVPNRLLFQARSNWGVGDQGSVSVTARNFRISDGRSVTAVPTVEVSAPESTEPAGSGEVTAPVSSSTPAPDTPAPDTSAPEPVTSVTSIQTASAASTSINYAEMMTAPDSEKSTAMVFIIIIAIAAVVVAGVVVGYLIYKKKKYY